LSSSPRPSVGTALRVFGAFASLLALGACGGGPQCVVDTHCKLDERCVERRCVPLGLADAGVDAAADAGDAAVDSATRDSSVRDSGMPDTGPALVGQIVALSDQVNLGAGPAPRTVATATFGPEVTDDCVHRTLGGCALIECPDTTPPVMDGGMDAAVDSGAVDSGAVDAAVDSGAVDAGPPPAAPNAGIIVISVTPAVVTLPPGADGIYAPALTSTLLWADGSATVNFNALGSATGIGMFNQSVPAPSTVTLSSPDATVDPVRLTRLSGTDIAWTGTTNGAVVVTLNQAAAAPSTATVSLRCDFDGAVNSGNIPAIALQAFDAGPASFSMISSSSAPISGLDPWQVEIIALASGALADGRAAQLSVILE